MSDDVLSVIPADPNWQPDAAAGARAAAIVESLAPGVPGGVAVEIDATWHDTPTFVDCGQNLERIVCPHCGNEIDTAWWEDFMDAHQEADLATLTTTVPCCSTATTLDVLEYDWPCGFARFEIAVWNPERTWFTDEELTLLARTLGHPVRQVQAHI